MLTFPPVLTHDVATRFSHELIQAVRSQPAEVVVDARGLRQFDSSALAVLIECHRQALAVGKAFSVLGAPARLFELASVYGVDALIPAALPTPS